ncbi:MAG: hypothetical protein LBL31_06920 [Spirochaetaceae bacterium]|jgi:hypothetical protein|nr:hypothetical protein [Spirochaetaceae bacterium]
MKYFFSNAGGFCFRRFFVTVLIAGLTACGGTVDRSYRLVLPDLPPAWRALLGDACWSVEWIDDAGTVRSAELPPGRELSVTVVNDASSPVLAFPYWPERDLKPGDMKPAGALFPWDARGGNIALSWQGGVDAAFWRGLSVAANAAAGKREAGSFNWKRWREAWNDGSFPPAAVRDPWLCDWESIAAKVAASGFDKRRIAAAHYSRLELPGATWPGVWYGPSPFDEGVSAPPGEILSLPLVPPSAFVFSNTGLLRYSPEGSFLHLPWRAPEGLF